MIIAFTGHRQISDYKLVADKIKSFVVDLMSSEEILFITGGAVGTDMIAAEAVISVGGRLVVAIPFPGYESKWSKSLLDRQDKIKEKAERVCYTCRGAYATWKLFHRNKWMVDKADSVFAIWDGRTTGGTVGMINYAIKQKKPVVAYDYKKDRIIDIKAEIRKW